MYEPRVRKIYFQALVQYYKNINKSTNKISNFLKLSYKESHTHTKKNYGKMKLEKSMSKGNIHKTLIQICQKLGTQSE